MLSANIQHKSQQKSSPSTNALKKLFCPINTSPTKDNEKNSTFIRQKRTYIGNYCYSPFQILGSGYTSTVYLGHSTIQPCQTYAIKIIDKNKLTPQQLNLIKNQLEIHPKLNHQHIVKCYDVFQDTRYIHIVLEYCQQGDLAALINKQKKITQTHVLNILKQIILAYQYLVTHIVLHRDLKPANILIKDGKMKIADFGFAHKGKKSIIDSMSVGTPLYMPPQSIQQCVYSHKSDFFAIGCIAYELLNGKTPWFKHDQKALAYVMKNRPINVSAIQNQNLKDFIISVCCISQASRMCVQEFMQIDLQKATISISITSQKMQRKMLNNEQTNYQLPTKSSDKNICSNSSLKNPSQTTQSINNKPKFLKITNQNIRFIMLGLEQKYQFCQRLRNLIRYSQRYVLVQDFDNKNLKIVLYRHSIYLCKAIIIEINKDKHDQLWITYKQSDQYNQFFILCKNLKEKLQKDLNLQLKGCSLKNLTQINRKFSQLNYQFELTKSFHQKLRLFLRELIKKFNLELMKKIKSSNMVTQTQRQQENKLYMSFRALYNYCQWNESRLNIFVNNQKNKKLPFCSSSFNIVNSTRACYNEKAMTSNRVLGINHHLSDKKSLRKMSQAQQQKGDLQRTKQSLTPSFVPLLKIANKPAKRQSIYLQQKLQSNRKTYQPQNPNSTQNNLQQFDYCLSRGNSLENDYVNSIGIWREESKIICKEQFLVLRKSIKWLW